MMKKLILLFAILVAASVSASAGPVFLTQAQLNSFTQIAFTQALDTPIHYTGGNAKYKGNWFGDQSGYADATISYTLPGALGGNLDTFSITVVNENGAPWDFAVRLNGAGAFSPTVTVVQGTSQTFSFVLGPGGLTQVEVRVSGMIPIMGTDRGPEFALTQVPEPTSMFLLGTGLVGLAGAARRRFRK